MARSGYWVFRVPRQALAIEERQMSNQDSRRAFLTIAGAGALLAACRDKPLPGRTTAASPSTSGAPEPKEDDGEDVSATEDLMREHGVIRRVLVIYRETAVHLRTKAASVPSDALQKAALLMRNFGEDYHEKQLEEANIFPVLRKGSGPLTAAVDTLTAQHQRGREITEYVLAVTKQTIGDRAAEPLARSLEDFARMYEEHAAIEDTIVFPAWKRALSPKQVDEIGDRFEEIEKKMFGKDGFEDAVKQVAALETSLGIELAGMMAASPPKS
jgi:hemerythrin-like domain-containing protein